ncbi:MAG: alpha/beta hydrolase family protein [Gemmatimonadota bacterium]
MTGGTVKGVVRAAVALLAVGIAGGGGSAAWAQESAVGAAAVGGTVVGARGSAAVDLGGAGELASRVRERPAVRTPAVSRIELPRPTGPHAVGRWTTVLTDTTRAEVLADDPGDRRELLVEFWYPGRGSVGRAVPYLDPATQEMWVDRFGFPAGFVSEVSTHSMSGGPALDGRHPVLIFSHGLSWPSAMYQSFFEELASHGYVVAAITHPYGADVVVFPDGRRFDFAVVPERISTDTARERVLAEYVGTWAADVRFVADELVAIDSGRSPVAGHLDLDRVGVFGHSYGGSASALALDHPRIRAGLSMEGRVRDSTMRPLHVPKPFMHMIGSYNRAEMVGTEYRAGDGPYYEVVLDGVWHAMFSDLIYLYAHYADADWHERHRWEVSPRRGIRLMRELLLAFFGRHLLGEDHVLLHPWSQEAPASMDTSELPEVHLRVDVR